MIATITFKMGLLILVAIILVIIGLKFIFSKTHSASDFFGNIIDGIFDIFD